MHYGFGHVRVGDNDDFDISCDGQANGLLGAVWADLLSLRFGVHTGRVRIRIESHPSAPAIDPYWEEIVEAPFTMAQCESLWLSGWDDSPATFSLPGGDYRVRYCAKDFGVHDEKCTEQRELDPLTEHYLLCFWQEARRPDAILKVTQPRAQYWHDVAQGRTS